MLLERTPDSPLDCMEIKPVNPKGNQSWIFTGRTDTEAEAPNLWPPDVKSRLIWKDLDAGKDWGQEEKGVTEDEIDSFSDSMDMNWSKLWDIVKDRRAWWLQSMGLQTAGHDWVTEWQQIVHSAKSSLNLYQINNYYI